MTRNFFHTRIPFFSTQDWTQQKELQVNKSEADEPYLFPTPNPGNWWPEFVMHRRFVVDEIESIVIHNVGTNATHATLDVAALMTVGFIKQYQIYVGSEPRIAVIFCGALAISSGSMPCGTYQYRLEDKAGNKYYSEWWRVESELSFLKLFTQYHTRFAYNATCYFGHIAYNKNPYYMNLLWVRSEGIMPETEIQEENVQDVAGNTISSSHRLQKKYLLSIPNVSAAMVDAINTLPMYCTGENVKCVVYTRSQGEFGTVPVIDVQVDKPDYGKNEAAPSMKMRIAIDPDLSDSGCCNTEEVICFDGINPPKATLQTAGTGKMKVLGTISTLSNWYETNGLIPNGAYFQIQYKKTTDGAWTTLPELYTSLQVQAGVQITGLTTGQAYHVRYILKTVEAGCDSEISTISDPVTIT